MRSGWYGMWGSNARPSRPRETGKAIFPLPFAVLVVRNCVDNQGQLSAFVTAPYLCTFVPPLFNRVGYIDAVRGPSICAVDLRGLLKVVPAHGAGDKEGEYCIDGFAIDRYTDLLTERQRMYPDMCTRTSFVKTHQLVSTSLPVRCSTRPSYK